MKAPEGPAEQAPQQETPNKSVDPQKSVADPTTWYGLIYRILAPILHNRFSAIILLSLLGFTVYRIAAHGMPCIPPDERSCTCPTGKPSVRRCSDSFHWES